MPLAKRYHFNSCAQLDILSKCNNCYFIDVNDICSDFFLNRVPVNKMPY